MLNANSVPVVLVVAGVFQRGHEFLLFQRLNIGMAPSKWEFPGGKVEAGELEILALQRELREELGIEVQVHDYISEAYWDSGQKTIHLRAYFVSGDTSQIRLVDHQNMQWVSKEDLLKYDLAAADIPIVHHLQKD